MSNLPFIIRLVSGDTGAPLYATLRDRNSPAAGYSEVDPCDPDSWAPIDLTGATVVIKIRQVGATTLTDTVTATLVDATNGRVVFGWSSATWAAAGEYDGEIEITGADTTITTIYDTVRFKVRAQF
jgi:hypothetical protein